MSRKMKYVKVEEYDSIVVFPTIIEHKSFRFLKPKSAGFCSISNNEIRCYGESVSLGIESHPDDSIEATKQYFSYGAAELLRKKLDLT